MTNKDHEKNRVAWNEMVEIHYHHPDYKLKEFLDGWLSLKAIEREALGDVSGKKLLHLLCQFGMDTLSWARLGAQVTGVDISDKSIEYAEKLKQLAGFPEAKFIRSDVLELEGKLDDQFDIIFMSHGTICWIEDMNALAKTIARYLKPGGTFFIVDSHPVEILFITDKIGYLDKNPDRNTGERDYCDRDYVIPHEMVEWQHPLSEIINSLIDAGLTIKRLDEYNKGFYAVEEDWYREGDYYYPPDGPPRYPIMFALRAVKE